MVCVCVCVCSRPRAGVLNAMDLTRLTRKHGIKITPAFPCSVEQREVTSFREVLYK